MIKHIPDLALGDQPDTQKAEAPALIIAGEEAEMRFTEGSLPPGDRISTGPTQRAQR